MKLLQVPMKAFMQQGQSDFAATAVFFCFVLFCFDFDKCCWIGDNYFV